MARLVVLTPTQDLGTVIVARRAHLRERIAARIGASRLDRQLAGGTSPAASAALSLRAEALGDPGARRALAAQLRQVVAYAQQGRRRAPGQVPIARGAILAAAKEIETLAERLESPGPVSAAGLAQVRLLLRDGSSPVYWRGARDSLRDAAADALEALEPEFRW